MAGYIKLSSNENPLGTSPRVQEALCQAASEAHLYPPVVSEELRQNIAKCRGTKPGQVICGRGSNEIFSLCAAAVIEKGRNAIGSQHSFSQYQFATLLFGGEYRALPTRGLAFDLEAMVAAIDADTRLLFLCSPNNPSGKIIPAAELQWALEKIPENIMVLIDQAYGEYVDDSAFPDGSKLIDKHPNLIVTGTLSKLFGLAAFRVGYGLASEDIIRQLHRLKSPFSMTRASQQAALAALSDTGFVEHSLRAHAESKALLYKGLRARGLEFCETQGNFICLRNPAGLNLAGLFEKHRIIVRKLDSWGLPDYIRITIPPRAIAEKILDILDTLPEPRGDLRKQGE